MLVIDNHTIHLWYAKLGFDNCTDFNLYLNDSDKVFAEKFKSLQKKRYIESLGRLKRVLSYYINEHPHQIKIDRHRHGKPFLTDYPNLVFNISHSGQYWIMVISQKCLLGVDIEQCQARKNLPALVNKCFSAKEIDYWNNLNVYKRLTAFYRLWTIKEAFVKATGRGIALGLANCEIDTDKWDFFLKLPEMYGDPETWHINAIDIDSEYVCSVVNNMNKKVFIKNMSDTFNL